MAGIKTTSKVGNKGQKTSVQPQLTFNQGLAFHQQGKLKQAQELYQQVLDRQPGHFDAKHLSGVIAYQTGNPQLAAKLIEEAVGISPLNAIALNHLGLALGDIKRESAALESFDKAIALKKDYAEAHCNRGTVLKQLGHLEAAVDSYNEAIRLQTNYPDAFYNRGNALRALKQPAAAIDSYKRAIALRPDFVNAYNNCGNAFRELEEFQSALDYFDKAIALKRNFAAAYINRGNTLRAMDLNQLAVVSYEQALQLSTTNVEAYFNRGNALCDLKEHKKALASFDQAILLHPTHSGAYCNRGATLINLLRHSEALESLDKAIVLDPHDANAYNNRGNALGNLMRHREAIESYEKAISLKPDYASAHLNQALYSLLIGDFASGWPQHEWRWKEELAKKFARHFSEPLWLGKESLNGRTILLHAEQGLGDTLQFCRYAHHVSELGAKVILEVPDALRAALKELHGVSHLVSKGSLLPVFDIHCPLLSLPLAFKTELATIPNSGKYLSADPRKVEVWINRLGPKNKPRVGLVWSGSTTHRNDENRSLPLTELIPHLPGGMDYVCLQKEIRQTDLDALIGYSNIRVVNETIEDFSDTAALCELVDVVISVDTSVAHLAGALGRPVWIALPFSPDWRWMLEREDSPWYSSAKLYRQQKPGDWESTVSRIGIDLRNLLT